MAVEGVVSDVLVEGVVAVDAVEGREVLVVVEGEVALDAVGRVKRVEVVVAVAVSYFGGCMQKYFVRYSSTLHERLQAHWYRRRPFITFLVNFPVVRQCMQIMDALLSSKRCSAMASFPSSSSIGRRRRVVVCVGCNCGCRTFLLL